MKNRHFSLSSLVFGALFIAPILNGCKQRNSNSTVSSEAEDRSKYLISEGARFILANEVFWPGRGRLDGSGPNPYAPIVTRLVENKLYSPMDFGIDSRFSAQFAESFSGLVHSSGKKQVKLSWNFGPREMPGLIGVGTLVSTFEIEILRPSMPADFKTGRVFSAKGATRVAKIQLHSAEFRWRESEQIDDIGIKGTIFSLSQYRQVDRVVTIQSSNKNAAAIHPNRAFYPVVGVVTVALNGQNINEIEKTLDHMSSPEGLAKAKDEHDQVIAEKRNKNPARWRDPSGSR